MKRDRWLQVAVQQPHHRCCNMRSHGCMLMYVEETLTQREEMPSGSRGRDLAARTTPPFTNGHASFRISVNSA